MSKIRAVVFLVLILPILSFGQNLDIVPTISPTFFSIDQEIEVSYDVTGTYMEDWSEAWLWTWLPTNSNTDAASNVNPANSNPAATDPAKFSKEQNGGQTFFKLTLTPSEFFTGISGTVENIGFLIKGNDWSDGQSIDYVTEVGEGLRIMVNEPSGSFGFHNAGSNINIDVTTSQLADIQIQVGSTVLANISNSNELTTTHAVIDDGTIHTIVITAVADSEVATAEYKYLVPPPVNQSPVPNGLVNGINYDIPNEQAILVLEAPGKENIFVIGDFNDWSIDNGYFMNQDGERFWLTLNNLNPNELYRFQYLIDGELRIADPYSERISSPFDDAEIIQDDRYPGLESYPFDKTTEGVSFLQINEQDPFQWTVPDFERPAKKDLTIYELLVRDFSDERTFDAVIEKLDYLESLGINALELMPVMEFEGNISWGYNPAFMFSVDKYYGTENKFKLLVDEAHKRGIAVILDIVLNHQFGRSPLVRIDNDDTYGPPTDDNVYFNRTPRHDFNVGYDMNHESDYTKSYIDRVNKFWIEEYKIDGFRFDLSKGFTQNNTLGSVSAWGNYDASRIALLKRMADEIWAVDNESYIILEHFAQNTEEQELSDYGMMLWGNMVGAYRSAAKGFSSNLGNVYHEARGWDDPHLIGYMESHDEERIMWEATRNNFQSTKVALIRAKAASVFYFLVPGPKMLWQFEEMGYDEELNNDRLGIKPTHWEYLDDPDRAKMVDLFSSLINLRSKTNYIDSEYFSWSPSGTFKWINIDHPDVKIAAFGNLGSSDASGIVQWPATGTWYDYFTGEEIIVDALVDNNYELREGETKIYVSTPIENYVTSNPLSDVISSIENVDGSPSMFLQLYPNPTSGEITISNLASADEINIYNTQGQLLLNQKIDKTSDKFNLSLEGFENGQYKIQVKKRGESIATESFQILK